MRHVCIMITFNACEALCRQLKLSQKLIRNKSLYFIVIISKPPRSIITFKCNINFTFYYNLLSMNVGLIEKKRRLEVGKEVTDFLSGTHGRSHVALRTPPQPPLPKPQPPTDTYAAYAIKW